MKTSTLMAGGLNFLFSQRKITKMEVVLKQGLRAAAWLSRQKTSQQQQHQSSVNANTLKQLLPTITAVGIMILASGCASKPTYKQGFDFSRYHNFALLPLPEKGSYQDPAIVTRLGRPAQESVVASLTAKGFKQTKEGEADFLVKMLFDWQPEKGRTEQRFFDIQIIDSKNKEVVWSRHHHRTTDTTFPTEVVGAVVTEMLKPFPPGSK